MELLNQSQIRERVEELTERSRPGKIRVFSDTSDFMDITAGDVIHVGGGYYYVYGEEVEGRFGLDDQPKFWVKRARDLETGQRKIIKLAFFEQFNMNLGDIRVECFRSPKKEARILRKTSDDEAFMKGIAAEDDAGNVVRILDRINGISIYSYLQGHKSPHEKFFHEEFPRLFPSVLSSVRAVERLHAAGEVHGDIRNDHLWLDRDRGGWRWIDFDYAYEWTENPFGVDLYGLGNILLFTAGNGSENSRRAMDYLASWAACSERARIMLVHVIKEPSQDVLPDQDERDKYIGEKKGAAEALLVKVKGRLESLGVSDSRITTKTLSCEPPTTIAEALLRERGAGAYDTIVLGRRGMSKKEEYIFGSGTTSLIREASDVSVWVVA